MNEYHKIQTVYKRDPETKFKTLLEEYAIPEFEYLKDNKWIFTEKVDGTNIRIMFNELGLSFGGKTDRAQIPAFLVNKLNTLFGGQADRLSKIFSDGGCLYGEGYGAKIQKGGGNYRDDQSFVLFDIKFGNWWLKREDVESIAEELHLGIVPIIGSGKLCDMVNIVKKGLTSTWGDFQAEGIVARPETELFTRGGHRIITKLKCKDFSESK